ncbi:MAG: PQQ-dependent sugar dehydrogenase [Acidobacteria bacterium]|nr:PQQ-dependent sugar dehydrogenase [Acidobacteriota bacterium]
MRVKFFVAALCLMCALAAGLQRASAVSTHAASQLESSLADPPTLAISPFVSGLSLPIGITHAGDNSGRLFIIQQTGRIRVVRNGTLLATPFLDISSRVSCCGERGLLGLAFPTNYWNKGYFYVNYTNTAGNTVVARYRRSANSPDVADPSSEDIVLVVAQPFANHNGGHLAFGPRDGQLYIGMGDGGDGGDPGNRAQNPNDLLGKILRIDVETGRPFTYTVHPSNPFVNRAGFRPEIWALGLRNPWRFSFDRQAADLYIGDVGQSNFEEIDFQPSTSTGGENYGWRIMEGAHCFNPSGCSVTGLTLPVFEYSHADGCSITGGYVYRGGAFPRMQGLYFYGDYCNGRIWALSRSGAAWQNSLLLDTSINISSFGEDEDGNLYAASHNSGEIFRLIDTAPGPSPTPTPPTRIKFEAASTAVPESQGSVQIRLTRTGDTSRETMVFYTTTSLVASPRGDYTPASGRLRFAPGDVTKSFEFLITNDETDEPNETVHFSAGFQIGFETFLSDMADLTIIDDDAETSATNPIDRSDFFVRRQYHDFLNREPDADGLAFWTGGIESCGTDTQTERDDLVRRLTEGTETRASAWRIVAEDDDFERAELNRAFVLMQYYGYLRRDPNAQPDMDFRGFDFWLDKLNDHGGDFRSAQMVDAFINSIEYRNRFRP